MKDGLAEIEHSLLQREPPLPANKCQGADRAKNAHTQGSADLSTHINVFIQAQYNPAAPTTPAATVIDRG
jgi:hypothetical protein